MVQSEERTRLKRALNYQLLIIDVFQWYTPARVDCRCVMAISSIVCMCNFHLLIADISSAVM